MCEILATFFNDLRFFFQTGASRLLRLAGEPVTETVEAQGNHVRGAGAILQATQQHFGLCLGFQASPQVTQLNCF